MKTLKIAIALLLLFAVGVSVFAITYNVAKKDVEVITIKEVETEYEYETVEKTVEVVNSNWISLDYDTRIRAINENTAEVEKTLHHVYDVRGIYLYTDTNYQGRYITVEDEFSAMVITKLRFKINTENGVIIGTSNRVMQGYEEKPLNIAMCITIDNERFNEEPNELDKRRVISKKMNNDTLAECIRFYEYDRYNSYGDLATQYDSNITDVDFAEEITVKVYRNNSHDGCIAQKVYSFK